jgi:hypothetical protein
MTVRRLGIIMHGVTGRMGTNHHLVRSILAIRDADGVVRVTIEDGVIALGSLAYPGFASTAMPDWGAMRPMPGAGESE